ncbi:hypothetical protein J437_LFUL011955 [Ladona fulva]|uniref:Uncharacterized protein n=1 Tax=Ladona fulva TaxID=123851 RepID=A0A8K0KBB4_LADFU|nr:hypothetical protein J437_LFUL011955 [Ladona fulva]
MCLPQANSMKRLLQTNVSFQFATALCERRFRILHGGTAFQKVFRVGRNFCCLLTLLRVILSVVFVRGTYTVICAISLASIFANPANPMGDSEGSVSEFSDSEDSYKPSDTEEDSDSTSSEDEEIEEVFSAEEDDGDNSERHFGVRRHSDVWTNCTDGAREFPYSGSDG